MNNIINNDGQMFLKTWVKDGYNAAFIRQEYSRYLANCTYASNNIHSGISSIKLDKAKKCATKLVKNFNRIIHDALNIK